MNNKKLFVIYLIFRVIIFIAFIIIGGIVITNVLLRIDFLQNLFPNYKSGVENPLMVLNLFLICLILIDEKIKPAFIEFQLFEDEIIIKTFNPHSYRKGNPFVLFGYKNGIKEFKISRVEYRDYSLAFGKFGLRKELKLQKIGNNGIYETSDINISLLDTRKYTNLIISIDRLRTKFCLN